MRRILRKFAFRHRSAPRTVPADGQNRTDDQPGRLTRRRLGVLLLVIVTVVGGFYWWRAQQPTQVEKNRKEVALTLEAVGALYDLPDESPVLATVADKKLLQEQPFFKMAENGDKVLVFNQAQKIILYRPSTNKIINFSNLNPAETVINETATQIEAPRGSATPATSSAISANTRPTISIYNGTSTVGLTQRVQLQLEQQKVGGDVVDRSNAASPSYEKTLVVAVTPLGDTLAAEISGLMGVSKSALPDGEVKPDSDILIIVGKDQIN